MRTRGYLVGLHDVNLYIQYERCLLFTRCHSFKRSTCLSLLCYGLSSLILAYTINGGDDCTLPALMLCPIIYEAVRGLLIV